MAKKEKEPKTNAVRMVAAKKIPYELHTYEAPEGFLELIHARDITKTTGYIKGGCSPVGMKKLFPTAIDERAKNHQRICVSGGKVGLQIELSPVDLAELVGAQFTHLTREE